MIDRRTILLSALATPLLATRGWSDTAGKVRIGLPTNSLSYVKIFAARALDTFAAQDVAMEFAQVPGGDPTVLAAVDSGDLDLAAVGGDSALAAVAKGQPFKLIYTLMGRLPYVLTVSNKYLQKVGVTKDAPLDKRIGVMANAIIGVSALGGAQDRVARWLALQGGLDPKAIKLAVVGSPAALGAALEAGRIDAFVLSPPESVIAASKGYGTVLVHPAKEIAGSGVLPSLVLAARADVSPPMQAAIVRSLRAMNAAASAIHDDPNGVADKITAKFFSKVDPSIIRASVNSLADGVSGDGHLSAQSIAALVKFATQTGNPAPTTKDFWTDSYAAAAAKKA
ncbi:MAG TPA: ABC transporter substrate-binding protein [Bradyrhizobium sp.]|nr:ABC transporter substrate-binding protein [Bradyrhizobium sp.]